MDMPFEKIIYIITDGALTIEVDEFLSHKKGLVLAEIELLIENTPFKTRLVRKRINWKS